MEHACTLRCRSPGRASGSRAPGAASCMPFITCSQPACCCTTSCLGAGPGQVDWSKLVAAISSELLSFDEAPDPAAFVASPRAAAAAAAQDALQPAAGGLQHQSSIASQIGSPRSAAAGGERLDINSGAPWAGQPGPCRLSSAFLVFSWCVWPPCSCAACCGYSAACLMPSNHVFQYNSRADNLLSLPLPLHDRRARHLLPVCTREQRPHASLLAAQLA